MAIPAFIGGIALLLLGRTSSPVLSIVLLSLVTLGIYSFYGPFFSFPSQFLTGFSAASGIALINSVANLGGFVWPLCNWGHKRTDGQSARRSDRDECFFVRISNAGTAPSKRGGLRCALIREPLSSIFLQVYSRMKCNPELPNDLSAASQTGAYFRSDCRQECCAKFAHNLGGFVDDEQSEKEEFPTTE